MSPTAAGLRGEGIGEKSRDDHQELRLGDEPRNAKEMYISWIGLVKKQKPQRRRA